MSIVKTSQNSARSYAPSRLPGPSSPAASPSSSPAASPSSGPAASGVDTSNLSPGAAARFEKLMRSIDDFTVAVGNKAITLPERK